MISTCKSHLVYFKIGIIFDLTRKSKVMKSSTKTIFGVLALGLLISCGTKKIVGDGDGQNLKKKTMSAKAQVGRATDNYDPMTITGSSISGNTLTMEVTYSGGCAEHDFKLVGSEMISKSLPPIRAVRLVHNANGDNCRAVVTEILKFDITDLAYQQKKGSQIMLNIEGVAEPLKYTYK